MVRVVLFFKIEGLKIGVDDYVIKFFYLEELVLWVYNIIKVWCEVWEKFMWVFNFDFKQVMVIFVDEDFLKCVFQFVEDNMDNIDLFVEVFVCEMVVSCFLFFIKIKVLINQILNNFIKWIWMKWVV